MKNINTCEDLYATLLHEKRIVIYGAGEYGRVIRWFLNTPIFEKKDICYAVTDPKDETIRGIDEFVIDKDHIFVLVTVSKLHMDAMIEEVEKRGFTRNAAITDELYYAISYKKMENNRLEQHFIKNINNAQIGNMKLQKQPRYPYMVLNILNHCNLRCQGCDHFACIADKYFVPYEAIERELARLNELTKGKISQVGIMGGEPLLHPDLLKILVCARKFLPETTLRLTTNGLLLNSQKQEFWDICHENNIVIVNTKYPLKTDYERIERIAAENKVRYMYFEGTGGETIKKSFKKTLDVNGLQNPVESFMKCSVSNYGNFLMEGKMYGCPFAGNMYIFNKKYGNEISISEDDYIDIYDENMTYEKMLEFASKPHPICRYCDVANWKYDIDWARTKQDKYEWLPHENDLKEKTSYYDW
ncbi:MAG: radical protein [Herbinix sp.]|jgi:organic radical activating enzyme|nr:radical protein [Herbinix sp.]